MLRHPSLGMNVIILAGIFVGLLGALAGICLFQLSQPVSLHPYSTGVLPWVGGIVLGGLCASVLLTRRIIRLITRTETSLRRQTQELATINESLRKEILQHQDAEIALRASQQYAQNIIHSSLDMIIAVDSDRRIIEFNTAAQNTFGYTAEEVVGKHVDLLYADNQEASSIYQNTVSTGQTIREIHNKRKNGETFPCLLSASILLDARDNPVGFMGISRDITRQKRAEDTLRQRNRELGLLSQLGELLQACRTEQETYHVIEKICKQFFPDDSGYLAIMNEMRNQLDLVGTWGDHVPEVTHFGLDDCWALRRSKMHFVKSPASGLLCPHLSSSPPEGYLCAPISASGEILGVLHMRFEPRAEQTAPLARLTGSKRMIVRRIADHYGLALVNLRLRETLKQDSIRDALTGLYNRRYLEGSLERETQRAHRRQTAVSILMIDVDHFKHLNDTYGHAAGDLVLRELGLFLRQYTRGEDIACRYGGEEFLVILPDCSQEHALARAEDLREDAQNLSLSYQGNSLQMTISIGVASLPEHGANVAEVVRCADEALYQAKAAGRNRVVMASTF